MLRSIVLAAVIFLSCVFPTTLASANPIKIVIIPYVDSAFAEGSISAHDNAFHYKEVIDPVIKQKLQTYFSPDKYSVLPFEQTMYALAKHGYDLPYLAYPDKDTLISIAKETGSDGIFALEISSFAGRSSRYIRLNVTMTARAYNVLTDKYITLKVDNASNKGKPAFKLPMSAGDNNLAVLFDETLDIILKKIPI